MQIVRTAQKQLGTLGSAIKKLDRTSSQMTSFRGLQKDTIKTKQAWNKAQSEVKRLAQEIRKTDKPSKKLQANFCRAKKEALITKQAFLQNKNAVRQMGLALKKAGIDTRNLSKEQATLGKSLETLRKRQVGLQRIENAKANNLAKRSAYRSQMLDAVALGGTLYGMVKPAIAFESAMADVKKVVAFDEGAKGRKQIKAMEGDIKNLAKTIPLSLEGLSAIVASGGQLGIPRKELKGFAETASKMSVAFDMSADESGTAMAKLSNVMKVPIGQIGKVGDVINHLSNNIAATAPEITKINLRAGDMANSFGLAYNETSALAGTFVSLGKTPEIAGTAINMMLNRMKLIPVATGKSRKSFNQLGISMKEYTKLVEEGKGKEAMLTILESLKKVKGVKHADIIKNIFGVFSVA